ncbi:hypothetical protein [Haloplasma contractile]|uniref:hypothetical protein n=1 Tax=Haloplasma contractile TaxID=471825 RepID=UPI000A0295D8|nr:hypothetical protein [Haloplasma contractile]
MVGLILPIIALFIATLPIITFLMSVASIGAYGQGEIIEVILGFFIFNIPTVILLAIYWVVVVV